jgi:hypothetical protein
LKKEQIYRYLSLTALAAGLALAGMLLVTLLNSGLTAQDFETFDAPERYAAALLAAEAPLRAIISLDNLFLIFYTAAFIFLATSAWKDRNRILVAVALGALLVTAYLDLNENHSIMVFIAMANQGITINAETLMRHDVLSQLKFHSSYLSFFLFAFVLPDKTPLEKILRWSLWLVFAPNGILVYTYPSPTLSLLRYLLMLSGLLLLAWNYWLRAQKKATD